MIECIKADSLVTLHYCIASADGDYNFDGRTFQSLSQIAREITGTRWSGPVFFGLKARTEKKAATRKGGRL